MALIISFYPLNHGNTAKIVTNVYLASSLFPHHHAVHHLYPIPASVAKHSLLLASQPHAPALSASEVAAGGRHTVLFLLRVVLQPVQRLGLLLKGLLEVGDEDLGILDLLAEALHTRLD